MGYFGLTKNQQLQEKMAANPTVVFEIVYILNIVYIE